MRRFCAWVLGSSLFLFSSPGAAPFALTGAGFLFGFLLGFSSVVYLPQQGRRAPFSYWSRLSLTRSSRPKQRRPRRCDAEGSWLPVKHLAQPTRISDLLP